MSELTEFQRRVLHVVRQIPEGRVATYGHIAHLAGSPRAARAVGSTLRNAIGAEDVPWHRVINAQGGISFKGDIARAETQRRLLQVEGLEFRARWTFELEVYEWTPEEAFWSVDWRDDELG